MVQNDDRSIDGDIENRNIDCPKKSIRPQKQMKEFGMQTLDYLGALENLQQIELQYSQTARLM